MKPTPILLIALLALPASAQPATVVVDPASPDTDTLVAFSTTLAGPVTWDFGDGTPPLAGAAVTHRFAYAGTYTVRAASGGTNLEREVGVRIPQRLYADAAPQAAAPSATPAPAATMAPRPTGGGFQVGPEVFLATILVVGGGLGSLVVLFLKRRQKAAAEAMAELDADDEDPPLGDLPADAFSSATRPDVEGLEDVLPLEPDQPTWGDGEPAQTPHAATSDVDPFALSSEAATSMEHKGVVPSEAGPRKARVKSEIDDAVLDDLVNRIDALDRESDSRGRP